MSRFTMPRLRRRQRNPLLYQVGTAFENGPGDDNVDWTARLLYFAFMGTLTVGGALSWVVAGPVMAVNKLRGLRRNRPAKSELPQNNT